MYTRRAITAATTALTTDGTRKDCHFWSVDVVSIWTRYISSGESGSTKGFKIFGTLVKGGMGPEVEEFGVELPDEAGVDAGVLRREDFVIVLYMVDQLGKLQLLSELSWFSLPGLLCALTLLSRRVRS